MSQERYEEFKSRMEKPIDTSGKRCECLKQRSDSFTLGGSAHTVIQCKNKATVKIISHREIDAPNPPPMTEQDRQRLINQRLIDDAAFPNARGNH